VDLNFAPPAEVSDLARRVADFVKTSIVPYEKDPRWTPHGPTDELRIEMNELAALPAFSRRMCPRSMADAPRPGRPRLRIRGGGLFHPGPDGDPLRLARRGQHPSARRRGAARPA